jgi:hypothetical protein
MYGGTLRSFWNTYAVIEIYINKFKILKTERKKITFLHLGIIQQKRSKEIVCKTKFLIDPTFCNYLLIFTILQY